VVNADTPVVFQDGRRTFVIMPLGKAAALAPDPEAVRITSAEGEAATRSLSPEKRKPVMKNLPVSRIVNGNGVLPTVNERAVLHSADNEAASTNGTGGIGALIQEAEALKAQLRDTFSRTNHLVAALKRHK